MSDEWTPRITLLTEGNYEVWHIQMTAVLIAADLWDVVRPLEEVTELLKGAQMQQKKRELAHSKIMLTLNPSQLPFVMGMEDPHEMWESVEDVHHSSLLNHALSLRRAFFRMFKNENETVIGWVAQVRARALELSYTPCPTTIIDIILIITEGLPPEYTPFITQLENVPITTLTVPAVMQCLISFESQLSCSHTGASSSMDLVAHVARTDVICHQCKGHGHFQRECPTPKGLAKPKKKVKEQGADEDEDEELEGCIVARYAHTDSEGPMELLWLY